MKNKFLELDKSSWILTKLGDLAKNISKRVDNPSESEYDRFVGLENFVSGDIKIKNWVTTENLASAAKAFQAGDILFARRNAYLRRASLVDFDGCCSGDAFVLRENHDEVVPGFLAFLLNSNSLWNFANSNAAGTMSKRVKWEDLAEYEFLLPPKDQQSEIAELLWSIDEVIQKEFALTSKLRIAREASFFDLVSKNSGIEMPLSEVLVLKKSKSQSPHDREKYIGLEHVQSGAFTCDEFSSSAEVSSQLNLVDLGDLCYSKLRPYLDKAFIATFDAVSTTELLIYQSKGVSKEYLLHHMHSRPFIEFVSGKGFGTKMPRISHKIIGEYKVKVLDDEQTVISAMKKIMITEDELRRKNCLSKALLNSLINEMF